MLCFFPDFLQLDAKAVGHSGEESCLLYVLINFNLGFRRCLLYCSGVCKSLHVQVAGPPVSHCEVSRLPPSHHTRHVSR